MMATRAIWSAVVFGTLTLPSMCNVYQSDVTKLCSAEQLSGATMKAGRDRVVDWMERSVVSSEGVLLVKDLSTRDTRGLGVELRDEARRAGVPTCALADQCDALAKEQDYATDLANLCAGNAARSDGSVARLEIGQSEDAERIREIIDWVAVNAKSPDTTPVVSKIAALGPRQRGAALRAEAAKVGVASCPLAAALDAPSSSPAAPAAVINPSFTVTKVDGPAKNQMVIAQAIVSPEEASAINACYAFALTPMPTLNGKVVTKLVLDATGKVVKATDDGSNLKGPLVQCIDTAMLNVALGQPPPDGGRKGAKASVTLSLAPTNGAGYSATIDPSLSKAPRRH